ncbi:MAG: RNA polymerase sigma factor [Agriterribacter sp.]
MELSVAQEQHIDLIARCRAGDAASFRKLYELYAKAMYNTSLRILNNISEAEDILQEAFVDAFKNINLFENRSSFGSWIKQIVINKSINQLKKKKIDFVEIEDPERYAPHQDDTIDEDEIQLQVDRVVDAMRQLPDGYRTVLSLYLLEGYDHEEIAGIMGVAESTARTQYIRGKQKLLKILYRGA